MSKHTKVFMPDGGWKPRSWYLVDVSYKESNPIHRNLFYSGFLDDEGYPAGYSGAIPANSTYMEEPPAQIHNLRYLKVIRLIVTEAEVNGTEEK